MNNRLHPLLQQQINRYLPADYTEHTDLNEFINEVNKSCYSPLATPIPPASEVSNEAAFLSIVNHEIRTPLNGLMGLIQLMQSEVIPPAWKDHFQTLQVSVDSMQLAVSNILDYRQIGIGQLSLTMAPFAPRQSLSTFLRATQQKTQGSAVSLTMFVADNVPNVVQGDSFRLNQILNNLITTVLTFTRSGTIDLRVMQQLQPDNSSATLFTLHIPTDDAMQYALLTSPSMRGESAKPQPFNGLGMAMFVSQRLLQLCGSSLQVSRQAGRSQTISFSIPFLPANTSDALLPARPTQPSLAGLRVLIVEDYHINIRIATRFLERWQIAVDVAENGQIALNKYEPGHYDLILMDVQMPVMDGLEATRAIRLLDQQVPIVALTASATPSDQANAFAAGMTSFLAKPFNSDELFQTLVRFGQRTA